MWDMQSYYLPSPWCILAFHVGFNFAFASTRQCTPETSQFISQENGVITCYHQIVIFYVLMFLSIVIKILLFIRFETFVVNKFIEKSNIFVDIMLCSLLKGNWPFRGIYCLHVLGLFDPEDGVICSSETLVDFHQNTQHYILEDRILHNHCCENLKSYVNVLSILEQSAVSKCNGFPTFDKQFSSLVWWVCIAVNCIHKYCWFPRGTVSLLQSRWVGT
jgi:hypothetical protein